MQCSVGDGDGQLNYLMTYSCCKSPVFEVKGELGETRERERERVTIDMLDTNQDPAGQITIRETARLDHRQVAATNTREGENLDSV